MLSLPRPVHDQMVAHCLSGLPEEACGLLGGDLETGEVVTCYPTRNLAASAKLYVAQAPDPAWHYVLVSLRDIEPVVRSYRIVDGGISEEPVRLLHR
jgi:proteasome lid subunit RPN8/RPN11